MLIVLSGRQRRGRLHTHRGGCAARGAEPERHLLLESLVAALLVTACSPKPADAPPQSREIGFDLSTLNAQGLYGPPNGLRALSYEFCIPATPAHVDEVRRIDTTVVFHLSSPGRIGCSGEQYLCVGHTHQPGFRAVLERLARLEYVSRIDQSFAEQ
ncbi:MAG: hypothetical protein ACREMV_07210 [Gemmatimonadales bacterium]